jgi:hypothetical protein
MGSSSAVAVVVWLGLLMTVRWLGCQSQTGDGECMVVGFWPEMENAQWSGGLVSGRRWRAHGGVEERRWRKRGTEKFGGKMVWGRNGYRMTEVGFQNQIFILLLLLLFFFKKKKNIKSQKALST